MECQTTFPSNTKLATYKLTFDFMIWVHVRAYYHDVIDVIKNIDMGCYGCMPGQ